jgi:hypothetical protein
MRTSSAFFLCLVLGAGGAQAQVARCANSVAAGLTILEFEVIPELLPAPDYPDAYDACVVRAGDPPVPKPPPSPWLDSQRTAYSDALKKQRVDILVAPFQNQGYGLERTERALMSADLAYHLDPAARVADPFLTARALGEGARRYDRDEIVELARAVGARKAVVGYVGHDLQHQMTVTIEVLEIEATGAGDTVTETVQRDWRGVRFSHADPPFVVFHRMLPSVVESLSLPVAAQPHERSVVTVREDAAVSLSDLTSEVKPLGASLALSLLGAMAAAEDERSRERLFERALVTSWHFDAPSADTTFLRAYALLNLEHRPAALALINGAPAAEFVALRALLNGNLPDAAAALSGVRNPLKRLMLAVHVDDLRFTYEQEGTPPATDAESAFGSDADEWLALAEGRSNDVNLWYVDEPGLLKALLDEIYPVAGLDAQSLIGGGRIVGAPTDDVAVDLATIRHVGRFVESADAPVCCSADSARPTAWDLAWLIEGRAEVRVSKYLRLSTVARSTPERSAEAIERYRSVFDGHPLFALARVDHARALSEEATGNTLERLRSEALEHARVAAASVAGQNPIAHRSLDALGRSAETDRYIEVYGFDYPRRSYWYPQPRQLMGVDYSASFAAEAQPYARTDLSALSRVTPTSPERDKALVVAALESRFVGHPSRAVMLRMLRPPRPSSGDPVADARVEVDESPEDWPLRNSLGTKLIQEHGRWKEAAELLLANPYFHSESPPQPVKVSNDAYDTGSIFYWGGHEELAIPFYEVAVKLRTGAESQMTSEIRLNILAGRYQQAAAGSYARAQRYEDVSAFRDFLSFLHALGYGEAAWDGFSQVASSFADPQIWVSALVGHRLEGKEEPEIRAWLKQPGIRDAQFRGSLFASRYAVLVNTSDHETPEDLGALVEEIEGEPASRVVRPGEHARPNPDDPGGMSWPVPRSAYAELLSIPPARVGTPVKSELAFFAGAYAALSHGRFDVAVEEFKAMANHYPIEWPGYTFALPYFAWAAAKTGDGAGFEKFLDAYKHPQPGFDVNLAHAFFHGARKDTERALELLDKALRARPSTDRRPVLVEYQYAQACEWLYQETKGEAFVDALLAWVVSQQAVQPTHAWPYAMEYAYARTPERKLRALAMTLYLDPKSPRIRAATAEERAEAEAWGAKNNPFLQEQNSPENGKPVARAPAGARRTG